jgi:3-hydroxyacyl-CoA dehydrogenase
MCNTDQRWDDDLPPVLLVGAGVVGRAIAEAHLRRSIPFCLADRDADALAIASQDWTGTGLSIRKTVLPIDGLSTIVVGKSDANVDRSSVMVIESIIERLDAKQELFGAVQEWIGEQAILCSNTSTLQIDAIAGDRLQWPGRVCGLHFFMPVHARAAVEVVAGNRSEDEAIEAIVRHAKRIGKHPIECHDGPGFIVNRMLSPYLNQALLLLCRGATETQIERAALAFGMPMSPLELIDWIGAPTMYHAGRAFMNAFPSRMNASPMVPALVKRKRFGRATGAGLYDYVGGERSDTLAEKTYELVEMYRTDNHSFDDGDVLKLLTIPMWIEASSLLEEGIASSMATVDLAMAGGLGFTCDLPWSDFFAQLGEHQIDSAIRHWQGTFRSMTR